MGLQNMAMAKINGAIVIHIRMWVVYFHDGHAASCLCVYCLCAYCVHFTACAGIPLAAVSACMWLLLNI